MEVIITLDIDSDEVEDLDDDDLTDHIEYIMRGVSLKMAPGREMGGVRDNLGNDIGMFEISQN
jgi:hypothetical protein